jgi:hypothetical protein
MRSKGIDLPYHLNPNEADNAKGADPLSRAATGSSQLPINLNAHTTTGTVPGSPVSAAADESVSFMRDNEAKHGSAEIESSKDKLGIFLDHILFGKRLNVERAQIFYESSLFKDIKKYEKPGKIPQGKSPVVDTGRILDEAMSALLPEIRSTFKLIIFDYIDSKLPWRAKFADKWTYGGISAAAVVRLISIVDFVLGGSPVTTDRTLQDYFGQDEDKWPKVSRIRLRLRALLGGAFLPPPDPKWKDYRKSRSVIIDLIKSQGGGVFRRINAPELAFGLLSLALQRHRLYQGSFPSCGLIALLSLEQPSTIVSFAAQMYRTGSAKFRRSQIDCSKSPIVSALDNTSSAIAMLAEHTDCLSYLVVASIFSTLKEGEPLKWKFGPSDVTNFSSTTGRRCQLQQKSECRSILNALYRDLKEQYDEDLKKLLAQGHKGSGRMLGTLRVLGHISPQLTKTIEDKVMDTVENGLKKPDIDPLADGGPLLALDEVKGVAKGDVGAAGHAVEIEDVIFSKGTKTIAIVFSSWGRRLRMTINEDLFYEHLVSLTVPESILNLVIGVQLWHVTPNKFDQQFLNFLQQLRGLEPWADPIL